MLKNLPANKIGMTQIFDDSQRVIPVTVVDFSSWFVTQVKTKENDGYVALQVGKLRKKYQGLDFDSNWLKNKADHFLYLREVALNKEEDVNSFVAGQELKLDNSHLDNGVLVSVTGISRGLGFQGVVKRWGFSGGPKSHGSKFHRIPGSSSHMRRQGEVIKGKRFPGHCGVKTVTVRGLQVVKLDKEAGCLFIKGALPGKKNSLLIISKQG